VKEGPGITDSVLEHMDKPSNTFSMSIKAQDAFDHISRSLTESTHRVIYEMGLRHGDALNKTSQTYSADRLSQLILRDSVYQGTLLVPVNMDQEMVDLIGDDEVEDD
jgi:hypothetical protein